MPAATALHDEDFITTSRAAELLHIPRTMLKRLQIPRHDIGARQVAYRAGDVFDFAANPKNSAALASLREIHDANAASRKRREARAKKPPRRRYLPPDAALIA